MEILNLEAAARPKVGTRQGEKDRKKGRIPAAVYGRKEAMVSVTIPSDGLHGILKAGTRLVKLTLGGKQELTYIREVGRHPITDEILHVDFGRASMTEKLSLKIPLKTKGVSKGVVSGEGQMDILMNEIPIQCLPTQIPKLIEHDVTAMEIGMVVKLRDLKLPEGVTIDGNVELLCITVHKAIEEIIAAPDAVAAAAAAEPEVLTAKKPEEGEAAAAGAPAAAGAKPAAAAAAPAAKGGGEKKKE
ncbi:MAG: large subunit ribosomal protein [Planctomycetota bacterium]|nr:MAG: large subunit ribosomal protein [Planctomycetota bacterium]